MTICVAACRGALRGFFRPRFLELGRVLMGAAETYSARRALRRPLAADTLFENILAIHRSGVAIVLAEQNADEALAISQRAYILVDGRNHRTGPARELAADPAIRRAFLGAAEVA